MSDPGPRPPAIAVWLLDRLLAPNARDMIAGDLAERFARDVPLRGTRAARWRFWWETIVALRHFGALHAPRPSFRQEDRMSSFVADVRHALRLLRRAPMFAVSAVITIALAVGPTTAIFSVVEPLLVRPLPYQNPGRLAFIWERDKDGRQVTTGYSTVQDVRARATSLESVAAVSSLSTTLSDPTQPERLFGSKITWNYFHTLGVRPALGRDFTTGDDQPNHAGVVILSHGLWIRRFGGDSTIVGRAIRLDGSPTTVVGVMPASYDDVIASTMGRAADVFIPLGYATTLPWACRSCRHLTAIARIRQGVTLEQALAELNQISAQLVRAYPKEYPAAGMFLKPMQEQITQSARPALLAIAGAVVLVLLIAVANVVNLQLARAVAREGEFAVRVALGAGAGRLTRQLVAEGLVIATAGGALGVALGWLTLPALVARLPRALPRVSAIHLDVGAMCAVTLIVLVLAIVLGLVPARGAHRRALFDGALRGAARVGAVSHHRTRGLLVMSEVGLAVLLLASAALLARSLTRLLAVNPGFDPANLVTLEIESSGPKYAQGPAVFAYRERVLAAVRAVPGVADAATSTALPLSGAIDRYGIVAEDQPLANPVLAPYATGYRVVGDYLGAMRIHPIEGRDLSPEDERDSSASPAIVSATLARRIWGTEHVVGKRIHVPNARANWSTVVGVVADVRHRSLDNDDGLAVYTPEPSWSWMNSNAVLVVRTRHVSADLIRAIRAAVHGIDPSQPITDVRTMDDVVSSSAAQRQLALTLFAAFAILAVLLSAAGIYGVLAGSVAERTREIGVRSALGATPSDLLRLVLNRGLGLALAGVVAGLGGAFAATRYLQALLYDVAPTDPLALGGAAAVLFVVAAFACVIPARRAIRIDPVAALRE